jgi:hypothetical protein
MQPARIMQNTRTHSARLSPRWLLECCKQRLVPLMERLQRERDAYTQVQFQVYTFG